MLGVVPVDGCEGGEPAQPLAFRRGGLERPGEGGERAPSRPADDVVLGEKGLELVPERARLARAAVVGGSLADEVEPLRGPSACRVEQVPVAAHAVGPEQPRAAAFGELAPPVVVEERRLATAAREGALLESEQEDGLEPAR